MFWAYCMSAPTAFTKVIATGGSGYAVNKAGLLHFLHNELAVQGGQKPTEGALTLNSKCLY